jgi:hypothetical protein
MRKLLGVLLCAAIALLASPVWATHHEEGGEEDESGWFVAVEARMLQPGGMPFDYVLEDPENDSDPVGEIREVEFDSEISPAIHFGWYKGAGAFYVSYWEYDEDDGDNVSSGSGELWDILYHADDAFEDYSGTAMAKASLEASTIDFAYSRDVTKSGRFTGRWMAGMRVAMIESKLNVIYDDGFGQNFVNLDAESEGFGIVGGASGSVKIAKKWQVVGGFRYSFLMGESETASNMYDSGSGPGDPFVDIESDEDRTISIFEATCGLMWSINETFHLRASYDFDVWDNVLDTHLFPDDVHEGFIQTDTSDVNWHGLSFAVGIVF